DGTLEAAKFNPQETTLLTLAWRPALWLRNARLVKEVLEKFDGQPSVATLENVAYRVTAVAGVAALEGRRSEAVAGWLDAIARFRDLGYEFEAARAALDAVMLLGHDEPGLKDAVVHARAVFIRV